MEQMAPTEYVGRAWIPPERMRIYVAGPYTRGDQAQNVRNAIYAGNFIAGLGHYPFIPHLSHFWHMLTPHDEIDFWYDQDMQWLRLCHAILRLDGESHGADEEVRTARELGLAVYTNVFDIPRFLPARREL